VGRVADKYGPRWLIVLGFLACLTSLVLLRLVTHGSIQQTVLLCSLLTLLGISLTLVMTPLMTEITCVVRAKKERYPSIFGKIGVYGQVNGLCSCFFAGGALIGPVWAGFLEERSGWGTLTWTLGLISGLTAIPVLIFTGGLITKSRLKRSGDTDSLQPGRLQWTRGFKCQSSNWISFLALILSLFKLFKPHPRRSSSGSDYQ
jgi:MFS family permease